MAEGTEEQLTEYVKKSKWIALQMDEFTDVQKTVSYAYNTVKAFKKKIMIIKRRFKMFEAVSDFARESAKSSTESKEISHIISMHF